MKSNVYTRTGDEGTTSLASGQRVAKTHVRLEAYGTIDELSSHLGLLISLLADEQDKARLRDIQNCLFDVSCELATVGKSPRRAITDDDVTHLEQAIDQLDALCGGWKGFILPGGTQAAAQAHVFHRLQVGLYTLAAHGPVHPVPERPGAAVAKAVHCHGAHGIHGPDSTHGYHHGTHHYHSTYNRAQSSCADI